MSQIVTDSDLEWDDRALHPPDDGPTKGTVRAGFLGRDKLGASITRADIATFLLDQLHETRFIRAAPAISN